MAKDKLVKDQDKVIVRLPDGMRDQLKAAADANNRSMNAEIVERLHLSLRSPEEQDRANQHSRVLRSEIRLMQEFMREMFVLGGGDEERLEKSDIFKRAGELDAERNKLEQQTEEGEDE